MFYRETRTRQDLSYIAICTLSILYNSKFILMATSLGTNAVVVTRVHCIFKRTSIPRILTCQGYSAGLARFPEEIFDITDSSKIVFPQSTRKYRKTVCSAFNYRSRGHKFESQPGQLTFMEIDCKNISFADSRQLLVIGESICMCTKYWLTV